MTNTNETRKIKCDSCPKSFPPAEFELDMLQRGKPVLAKNCTRCRAKKLAIARRCAAKAKAATPKQPITADSELNRLMAWAPPGKSSEVRRD